MTDEQIDAIWACTDSRGSTTFEPHQWQREMRLRFARALLSESKPAVATADCDDAYQQWATSCDFRAYQKHGFDAGFRAALAASPAAPAMTMTDEQIHASNVRVMRSTNSQGGHV